jgi:NAD(P)H-flavin reductase
MSGLHFHPLRVRDVRPDTDDAVVVTFDVPKDQASDFAFAPGQYLTLRHEVAGQDLRRSYSICSAAGEPLRVGVRRVAGGATTTGAATAGARTVLAICTSSSRGLQRAIHRLLVNARPVISDLRIRAAIEIERG